MGLVYNKYPGEWHGPGSISRVVRDLNRIYAPVENLKILHFADGMIYYDKILKSGCDRRADDYMKRKMSAGFSEMADDKISKIQ